MGVVNPTIKHLVLAILMGGLAFSSGGRLYADRTVVINPATSWGTWEGWGCSLCWWAAEFGNRNDLADILFTTQTTQLNGEPLPGLGMTIARYNAGACSWNSINGTTMQESGKVNPSRQMEGFWLDWNSSDPQSGSWNWTVDANQRQMVVKAQSRGVTHIELFSNSPMWWMCTNHNPSGADNGANDNLQSWNQRSHAVYMATVAQYFHDHWGIDFTSVDPFNEPIADWWTAQGTQEGCHFDRSTQAAVLGYLRAELDSRGLGALPISASDESTYTMALGTWDRFDASTKTLIDQTNVHGYEYASGPRQKLYYRLAGRKLWNSEYGEGDASGLSLAQNLSRDLRFLHPTAWCYWQPLDWSGWGLIQSNLGDHWIGNANRKYYVLAQYTRHIRPGFTLIDSGEEQTVAAYNSDSRELVLVTVNEGVGQWITYDLSGLASVTGPVKHWRTHTGTGDKYAVQPDLAMAGNRFAAWLDGNCVETFVIKGADQPADGIGVTPRPGYWYALLARHSGKCLEVQGDATATGEGVNVQQWRYQQELNQQWKLEQAGGGYYRLTPRHAVDKCLAVAAGDTANGANLVQMTYTGAGHQKWRPVAAVDGAFALLSQASEKCVDIGNVSVSDGANALQWTCSGANNQLWRFDPVEPVCPIGGAEGDFNGDCWVDLDDFTILGHAWQGVCGGSPLEAVFGGGCQVGLAHLMVLAGNWLASGWPGGERGRLP